ncbi:MAG TPA: hypothetical protein VKW78_11015 [Terriglobales bacterium]|nr:hypothetical protein [Terriglobales bacterium]
MTCNELRERWQQERPHSQDAEFLAHVECCTDCRHWLTIEERVQRDLRDLREFAPSVPASVDARITSIYHRGMSEPERNPLPIPRVRFSFPMWRAATAAVLLCGIILLFGTRKAIITPQQQHQAATRTAQPLSHTQTEAQPAAHNPAKDRPQMARHGSHIAPQKLAKTPKQPAIDSSVASGFHNLMYCDQLSCSGTMDVIRVKLPASALAGWGAPLMQNNNVVSADVVVGADGVARAIRFVN